MTLYTSRTLADYPSDTVSLACERCGRSGRYRKATLIERFGDDVTLPDLRHLIAECPRYGQPGESCGLHYVEP